MTTTMPEVEEAEEGERGGGGGPNGGTGGGRGRGGGEGGGGGSIKCDNLHLPRNTLLRERDNLRPARPPPFPSAVEAQGLGQSCPELRVLLHLPGPLCQLPTQALVFEPPRLPADRGAAP